MQSRTSSTTPRSSRTWSAARRTTSWRDLTTISDQVQSITDLLRQETQDAKDEVDKNLVEDISDQIDSDQQRTGCVSSSTNNGEVQGDVNVAGIAGSMAIEYDFDPEDDLVKEGDRSLDITYQTKAVIRRSVNHGTITGKKDQAGGVVGRMDLGQVTHCENYGTVSSTDGSYVGGIAGGSWGTIRESWSRCTLSGDHYVGGIAGYGTNLKNCRSAVEITDAKAYTGTIAGDRDTEGIVTGNTFTHDSLGGIDGISYAGKATPVTFSALCASGAPSTFAQMELTFQADGKLVETVPFTYGEGLDSLPDIPAKKGYSAAWPDMDYSHLTASQTLEAIYTPYTSSLTDGGQLPEILVDGSFSAQTEVSHTSQEVSWTTERGRTYNGQGYTVTVNDPTLDVVSYTVHCRIPEEGGWYSVWMEQDDGTWVRQDSTKDGSYLLFPATAQSVTFCLIQEPSALPAPRAHRHFGGRAALPPLVPEEGQEESDGRGEGGETAEAQETQKEIQPAEKEITSSQMRQCPAILPNKNSAGTVATIPALFVYYDAKSKGKLSLRSLFSVLPGPGR